MGFISIQNKRKNFINSNADKDRVVCEGSNNILISAPHGVSQFRLGQIKARERGSLSTALYLKGKTKCYLIAKSKNNNDDVNYDEESAYKDSIKKLIKEKNIKYVIDIHGLNKERTCDVNLGTRLGENIKCDEKIFYDLYDRLVDEFFVV